MRTLTDEDIEAIANAVALEINLHKEARLDAEYLASPPTDRHERGCVAMTQADRIEQKLDRLLQLMGGAAPTVDDTEKMIFATGGTQALKEFARAECERKRAAKSKHI